MYVRSCKGTLVNAAENLKPTIFSSNQVPEVIDLAAVVGEGSHFYGQKPFQSANPRHKFLILDSQNASAVIRRSDRRELSKKRRRPFHICKCTLKLQLESWCTHKEI